MELVVNHGNISIRDSKRVSVNLHGAKAKTGNINHFIHKSGHQFYTQDVIFSNVDDNVINITMFSDTKEDLLDPTKKVKEIKK